MSKSDSRKDEWAGYLRTMMRIRQFEDKVFELLAKDAIKGASHVYAGEEAVPAGLLRLNVGCEFIDDLWTDLNRALDSVS